MGWVVEWGGKFVVEVGNVLTFAGMSWREGVEGQRRMAFLGTGKRRGNVLELDLG